MPQTVTLTLTRLQVSALMSLVLDRYMESGKPEFDKTDEWIDVTTNETVFVHDLLTLLGTV